MKLENDPLKEYITPYFNEVLFKQAIPKPICNSILEDIDLSPFYYYLYDRIKERAIDEYGVSLQKARKVLADYRIPKILHHKVFKVMEEKKLIKKNRTVIYFQIPNF